MRLSLKALKKCNYKVSSLQDVTSSDVTAWTNEQDVEQFT